MPKEYKIIKKPNLFIDENCKTSSKDGYISYRMVICHAIHRLVHEKDLNIQEYNIIHAKLKDLIRDFDNKGVASDDFLETHIIPEKIVLVVDRTEGCYPLVLYFNPRNGDQRLPAFKKALEDINSNLQKILAAIKSSKSFNDSLYHELERYFNFEKNANKPKP